MWDKVSSKSARVVVVYLTTSLQGQDFGCKDHVQRQQLKSGGVFISLRGLSFLPTQGTWGMEKSLSQGRERWLHLG